MVGVEIVGTITTVITTVVLVGGMILGAVRWQTGQAEKKANKVKEEIESAAKIVKDETTKHVTDLKAYSDNSAKNLEQKIAEVDRKVIEMLDDLRKRADFTNGAVSSIRTDIADLQDEMERMARTTGAGDSDDEVAESRRRNERRRREKRRAIERDRIEQSENYLKHGRG
jgi:polyhydroxyalkanoate synthesis regulator phasin